MTIGIGYCIPNRKAGINWSSYWATRTPSLLVLTVLSDISIKLDWTNAGTADYDGQSIERSMDGSYYSEIDTVAAGVTTFTDTGLTAETQYYYRVRAYKNDNYSDYSNVDNDITNVTPLLDSYSGALGAFGLRLLSSSYEGNCIKVRRSSDDAELDIGFLNGYLDEVSLLVFAGAGDAFVTTFYDQSGNGNNATQTTPGNQPQIVDEGAMIVQDGIKVMSFNGTSQGFAVDAMCASISGTNTPLSVFMAQYTSTAAESVLLSFANTGLSGYPFRQYMSPYIGTNRGCVYKRNNDASTTVLKQANMANSSSHLFTVIDVGTGAEYVDGSYAVLAAEETKDLSVGAITVNTGSIGYLRRSTISGYYNGGLNELIIYASDKSTDRENIEININKALASPFFV